MNSGRTKNRRREKTHFERISCHCYCANIININLMMEMFLLFAQEPDAHETEMCAFSSEFNQDHKTKMITSQEAAYKCCSSIIWHSIFVLFDFDSEISIESNTIYNIEAYPLYSSFMEFLFIMKQQKQLKSRDRDRKKTLAKSIWFQWWGKK